MSICSILDLYLIIKKEIFSKNLMIHNTQDHGSLYLEFKIEAPLLLHAPQSLHLDNCFLKPDKPYPDNEQKINDGTHIMLLHCITQACQAKARNYKHLLTRNLDQFVICTSFKNLILHSFATHLMKLSVALLLFITC